MRLGVAGAVVEGQAVPGDMAVDAGRVEAVGLAPGGHGTAVPGFVDLQGNGFAGVDFLATDLDGYRRAGTALAATGVSAYQPTLISSPLRDYWPALQVAGEAAALAGGPRMLGVHLEGPFLSPAFAGAHDPANLRDPDLELVDRLCDAGPVTYMTVAPERPGGLDLVGRLVARGVVVALGHCDTDAATAHAAFNRGAHAVTHLHNAHRRWRARDPGVAGVALVRDDVVVQAIVDGVHLAPDTVRAVLRAARGRFALVTDAVEAAGLPPGRYRLGDRPVAVTERDVRLDDGTLAGSVLTMGRAVLNLVELGATLVDAVDAASRVPAQLVGSPELGTLRPGSVADVTVLDDALEVSRTLIGGREAFAR